MAGASTPSSAAALALTGSRTVRLEAAQLVSMTATLHGTLAAGFLIAQTFLTLDRIGPVRWTG